MTRTGNKVDSLLWMDDVCLIHHDQEKLQEILNVTNYVAQKYHIEFGAAKCKVVKIGTGTKSEIRLNDQILEEVTPYKYLRELINNKARQPRWPPNGNVNQDKSNNCPDYRRNSQQRVQRNKNESNMTTHWCNDNTHTHLCSCSGDRVAVRLWRHYSGWGSASSGKIQGDRTRKPDWANVPLSALKLLAVESWNLRKANLRVSGLCYRAGATHGLPCTEVILCVVVCVLGPCHCVVPAVNSAGAGTVIRGNCRESALSPRQSHLPHSWRMELHQRGTWKNTNYLQWGPENNPQGT